MDRIRTRFVQIGNSRGLRIPKFLIDQLGLGGDVEIAVERNRLVIRPSAQRRSGWDKAFRAMGERGDDALVDSPQPTAWDDGEWQW